MSNYDTIGISSSVVGHSKGFEKDLKLFEGFGIKDNKEQYATRKQVRQLYKVPAMTLSDNIKKLKSDKLVNGTKIRMVAHDGRQRLIEVFGINEVIAIGFRLRSDTAIQLQRYAASLMVKKMSMLELELSYAWNKSDLKDLYR